LIVVVVETEIENDGVTMQEMYLSADERQSTIRQSGGGDNGVIVAIEPEIRIDDSPGEKNEVWEC
jgi:hypothetical protein